MNKLDNPGMQKALNFLMGQLEKKEWKKGEKLPSLKILALQKKLQYKDLIAAVSILQKKRLLASRKKAGTFVGPEVPVQKKRPKEQRTLRYHFVKEQIIKELREGTFYGKDYLPGFKELKTIFQTTFPILKKALQNLVEMDLLSHGKRRYSICRPSQKMPINAIGFITGQTSYSLALWLSERTWLEIFMGTLEKECLHRNILLNKIFLPIEHQPQPLEKNVLGYIVWLFEFGEKESKEMFNYFQVLSEGGKPIAVVLNSYQTNTQDFIRIAQSHTNVYLIQFPDNFGHARMLGRFLIDKGYKKAVYFYPAEIPWAIERYQGLVDAFTQRGLDGAIVPFAATKDELEQPDLSHIDQSDKAVITKMVNKKQMLDSFLTTLQNEIQHNSYCSIDERFVSQIYEMHNGLMFRTGFQRLFNEAVKIKGKVVWICADDYIANYAALPFLTENKIAIPQRVGLTGFNNQAESLINGVTSVNFDFPTMALRSINFILYPNDAQWKKDRKNGAIVKVKGMVIDRGSV